MVGFLLLFCFETGFHYIIQASLKDQGGLELRDTPVSASWVLGLKAHTTTVPRKTGFAFLFIGCLLQVELNTSSCFRLLSAGMTGVSHLVLRTASEEIKWFSEFFKRPSSSFFHTKSIAPKHSSVGCTEDSDSWRHLLGLRSHPTNHMKTNLSQTAIVY